MRRLTRGTIREARNILTLTRARTSGSGVAGVAIPQPTAQSEMLIADATPAWTLLAAPTGEFQVPIAGADPYTPAWAALTVEVISDLAYATPALTLSTANAEGAAATVIRSDATVLIFDATVPNTIQPDDTAAAGSAAVAARRDHEHAIVCAAPADPSVSLAASAEGTDTSFARADHVHQLDQAIAPTWTALHTFGAHIELSAATSHIRMNTSDGSDDKRIVLCGGGDDAHTRGGLIWLDGNEYTGAEGEISIIAGDVTGGDIVLWTATVTRMKITHAGVLTMSVADDTAQAMKITDAGGIEYLRIVSTDAQPVMVFNEGGADVDHRIEASGQTNALFVRGSDGKVGIWTSTLNARVEIGGTPGPAILNLPTNLTTIDAGLSTRSIAGESIVMFGTNVDTSYTGRVVAAKAGALIRCDTRDQDGGTGSGNRYTIFQVITRAGGGSYTVPLQIAAGAPTASFWITRAGDINLGGNVIVADGASVGISDALERIVFGAAGYISVMGASLGVGTLTPQYQSHVWLGDAGTDPAWEAAVRRGLLIESSDEVHLTLFTPNTKTGRIQFADPESIIGGYIAYVHSADYMILGAAGAEQVRINATGLGIKCTPNSLFEINCATENVEIVDGGSAGATEQDWIEVEIGGVTGYLRVFAAK